MKSRMTSSSKAHPRACGENRMKVFEALQKAGSSPRMRGKLSPARVYIAFDGLIPAHAGKTSRASPKSLLCLAHPRACGENPNIGRASSHSTGSSPRMRGKLFFGVVFTRARGLIPAHAGKTSVGRAHFGVWWAHPRACGENSQHLKGVEMETGSSPRMRGKQNARYPELNAMGLIPAHAGKTASA